MLSRKSAIWLCLGFIVVFAAAGAQAKGQTDMVTIVGPEWYGEIELTKHEALEHLGSAAFEDFNTPVEAPSALKQGYLMTRFSLLEGEYQAFDRVLYFADPRGSLGYVYYLGMVDAHGPYDGKWYRVSKAGEEALLNALQSSGVRLTSGPTLEHGAPPGGENRLKQSRWLFTLLGGLGTGWFLGRRKLNRPA